VAALRSADPPFKEYYGLCIGLRDGKAYKGKQQVYTANNNNNNNNNKKQAHNFPSSRLLSKNVKIRIYKRIILPDVVHGCEKGL
jgi:hypothetical protein